MPHMHHHHRRGAEPGTLHQRSPRDAFPDAAAVASAFANPFAEAYPEPKTSSLTTLAKAAKTVYQTVYYTQAATFAGPVSYVTLSNQASTTQAPSFTQASSSNSFDQQAAASSQQAAQQSQQAQQSLDAQSSLAAQQSQQSQETQQSQQSSQSDQSQNQSVAPPTTTITSTGDPVTVTSATSSSASSSSVVASSTSGGAEAVNTAAGSNTASAASSTASPVVNDPTDTSHGLTNGAKAGIAFVVILGIAGIAALIAYFILKKKRKEREVYQRTEDEKSGFARSASVAAPRAPRLSLRPLTQFAPSFGANRRSGNLLGGAAAGTAAGIAMKEKPSNAEGLARNPFGDHAAVPAATSHARVAGPGVFSINTDHADGPENPIATPPYPPPSHGNGVATLAETGMVGASAAAVPRRLNDRPTTPSATKFEDMNAVSDANAISPSDVAPMAAAAGVLPTTGPTAVPVHRVQLDFKPSMADELELQTGQLVKLVKEYDDGWALCNRLGSAEQGVCPRTCLSSRPVKPRPPPGHINTNVNMGPRGPPGQMRGPMGPGAPYAQRPASPASGRNSPMYPPGRPMTPNGGQGPRPMSPANRGPRPASPAGSYRPMPGPRPASPAGQQGRARSPSASQANNGQGWSAPGPSRMNPRNPNVAGPAPIAMPVPSVQAGPKAVARKPVGSSTSGDNSPENPSMLTNA